jgi:hypothetical protein
LSNDIEIWQRLAGGETADVSRLVADLRVLAGLENSGRFLFAGLVEPLAGHEDPAVREAAVTFLAGAQGSWGLRRLVTALDDRDVRVRDAAVRALRASAGTQPHRWAHVVFHARADVRTSALRIGGPPSAEAIGFGIYLRTDPANAELAKKSAWPKQPLELAVDLFDRGAASAEETGAFIIATPPAKLGNFLHTRRPDIFDVILRAASEHPDGRRKVCEALARATFQRHHFELRARLVAALLRCRRLGPDAVALASVIDKDVLSSTGISEGALSTLEWWLWRLREEAPKIRDKKQLRALLDLPVFRDAAGEPRLSLAAALCGLYGGRPLYLLVRHFGEEAVVETLCTHPAQWAAFCRLPRETPNEALRLLGVVAGRDHLVWQQLVAITLVHWAASEPALAEPLLQAIPDRELGDVLEAFVRELKPTDEKSALRAVSSLGGLLQARLAGRDTDAVLARVLNLAAPNAQIANELALSLLRALAEADLVRSVRRLSPSLQLHLVRLCDAVFQLTWSHELAIARVLQDSEDPHVRRWAGRAIKGAEARPATARPTIVAVHTVGDEEAKRIATCAEADLEKALAVVLDRPSLGLCAALFKRPDPAAPVLSICAALLGCGDPLPEVHQAFERFGSTDVPFLTNLDHAAATLWQGNAGIPPLGHAWLHRWEQHAFALAAWLETQDIRERFAELAALPPGLVRQQLWEAFGHVALLFRYREPARLQRWATVEVLDILLAALGASDSAAAAKVVVALVEGRYLAGEEARIRKRILEVAPDMDRETRYRLSALARFDGIPDAARPGAAEKPAPGTIDEVRRATDPEALLRVCRDSNRTLVAEALLRLLELGSEAGPAFQALAREWPQLPRPVPIAESISLWTDEGAIGIVRASVSDPKLSPEARFRAARGLLERGEQRFLDDALVAAIVDDASAWFRPADWGTLTRHADATVCALALAQSPHPHAYQNAVEHLLAQPHTREIAAGLRDFLAVGAHRPLHLRRTVARRLLERGDTFGVPIVAGMFLDHEEQLALDLLSAMPAATRDRVVVALTAAELTVGPPLGAAKRIMQLAASGHVSRACAQDVYMQLLEHSSDGNDRKEASQRAEPGPGRNAKLAALARAFAWGVRRGRDLTGRLFRVHMTPERQELGYTFLNESRIFVSPLPLLRGDQNGPAIVEGLILHELGHHRYHRGEAAAGIWRRAEKDGLGPLLNLVADEHLERNLRAMDAEHGDRLKQLSAHAFLHASREVGVQSLLDALLGGACEALTDVALGVAHRVDAVEIESGSLLRVLAWREGSFARFVRALRLGQGNRWNDPLVEKALAHFGAGFRRLDMAGLFAVTQAVAELFGGRHAVAALFGGHESIPWSALESDQHGENISDDEVQREVERILDPRQANSGPASGRPDRFALNVNPKEEFDRIDHVERLPHDPVKHRAVALHVRRHSMRLRDFFDRLGRSLVPHRGRLRGRALDRTRVRAVVTRRDPRMLVARETAVANDVSVATVIDCSGSMNAFDNLEKAKRFGVLVAEAVRDLSGVDARFFGFTDTVIFDAGDGDRCAVTSMEVQGGNNDAAALFHAARVAAASPRRTRVLVMISDGLPTECSTSALRALVTNLGRKGFVCAQVAVHPLEEVCFPNYVVLDEKNMDQSVARFGELIMKLVTRGKA